MLTALAAFTCLFSASAPGIPPSVTTANANPPVSPAEPPAGAVVEQPARIGLASADLLLSFDRRTGEVTDIIHRPSGQQFASKARGPLFTLALIDPTVTVRGAPAVLWHRPKNLAIGISREDETPVDSRSFRRVDISAEKPQALRLIFRDHPTRDLSAEVTVRIDERGAVCFRLRVHNGTNSTIRRVLFPHVPWSPRLGDDIADDRLLFPFHDGQLFSSPGKWDGFMEAEYPGMACAQFAAYYDRRAGVCLAAEDAAGHPKRWQRDTRAGRQVAVNLLHLLEEPPGNDVQLDYDVVLHAFAGDWRAAARAYKSWATKQPWCAKKLAERTDVPPLLKKGSGVIIESGFQNSNATAEKYGQNLEKLPEFVEAYRRKTGLAHVVFVPYGWENRGNWAGINYFPAHPSNEAWSKTAQRLRENGDGLMFLTSGFWWVVKRQDVGLGPAFDDSEQIEQYKPTLIKNPDGAPWFLDCYDIAKNPKQIWRGLSMHLCHGSAEAQAKMNEIFLQAAKLGATIVSFDQEQGGAQAAPCYDPSHEHGRGYGTYIWTGLRETCEKILADARAINPQVGLCMEDTCELAIPYMATYWSRQFKGGFDEDMPPVNDYPNSVGLFSYLYHEYVTAIGAACVQGQGDKRIRPPAEVRSFILSNNLCRGLVPGPFARDVPIDPKDDWQKKVSSAHFSYCQPYAHFPEYLVLGEAVPPPIVKCARVTVDVPNTTPARTGGKQPARPQTPQVRFAAVNAGSFRSADGSVGTVLANTTDEVQAAEVLVSAPRLSLTLYDAHRRELQRWTSCGTDRTIRIDLKPWETRVLVAR